MSTSEPLDPKRPWITDLDDLPQKSITLRTMISPFGESARVPFRRAYMILLFISLPFVFMLLFAALGSGGALFPLSILGLVSVFLTIAHVRRLNHAGRNPLLAGLVVLPIVLGFAIFAITAPPHVEEANRIVAQIEADRADPEGAAKRRADAARQVRAGGSTMRGRGGPQSRRGGRRGPPRGGAQSGRGGGGNFDPASYVINASSAWPARAGLLGWIAVTLWSLMWVARLPRAVR